MVSFSSSAQFATEIFHSASRQLLSDVVSLVSFILHRIYSSGNRKVLDIRDSTNVQNLAEVDQSSKDVGTDQKLG